MRIHPGASGAYVRARALASLLLFLTVIIGPSQQADAQVWFRLHDFEHSTQTLVVEIDLVAPSTINGLAGFQFLVEGISIDLVVSSLPPNYPISYRNGDSFILGYAEDDSASLGSGRHELFEITLTPDAGTACLAAPVFSDEEGEIIDVEWSNCTALGVDLRFGEFNDITATDLKVDILMDNYDDVAGYEYGATGLVVLNATNGTDGGDFLVSLRDEAIVGYTPGGNPLAPGDELIINQLTVDITDGPGICLYNPLFATPEAEELLLADPPCLGVHLRYGDYNTVQARIPILMTNIREVAGLQFEAEGVDQRAPVAISTINPNWAWQEDDGRIVLWDTSGVPLPPGRDVVIATLENVVLREPLQCFDDIEASDGDADPLWTSSDPCIDLTASGPSFWDCPSNDLYDGVDGPNAFLPGVFPDLTVDMCFAQEHPAFTNSIREMSVRLFGPPGELDPAGDLLYFRDFPEGSDPDDFQPGTGWHLPDCDSTQPGAAATWCRDGDDVDLFGQFYIPKVVGDYSIRYEILRQNAPGEDPVLDFIEYDFTVIDLMESCWRLLTALEYQMATFDLAEPDQRPADPDIQELITETRDTVGHMWAAAHWGETLPGAEDIVLAATEYIHQDLVDIWDELESAGHTGWSEELADRVYELHTILATLVGEELKEMEEAPIEQVQDNAGEQVITDEMTDAVVAIGDNYDDGIGEGAEGLLFVANRIDATGATDTVNRLEEDIALDCDRTLDPSETNCNLTQTELREAAHELAARMCSKIGDLLLVVQTANGYPETAGLMYGEEVLILMNAQCAALQEEIRAYRDDEMWPDGFGTPTVQNPRILEMILSALLLNDAWEEFREERLPYGAFEMMTLELNYGLVDQIFPIIATNICGTSNPYEHPIIAENLRRWAYLASELAGFVTLYETDPVTAFNQAMFTDVEGWVSYGDPTDAAGVPTRDYTRLTTECGMMLVFNTAYTGSSCNSDNVVYEHDPFVWEDFEAEGCVNAAFPFLPEWDLLTCGVGCPE